MSPVRERGNWKLRALDRYFGIPLVFLLGLTRRKASRPPASPGTIGLLMTTAIGDTILNTAAIALLRKRYPNARMLGFCSAGNLGMMKMIGELDEVVPIPMTEPARAVKLIRDRGPLDVWIDFGPWPRINAVLSHFAPAGFKIGFKGGGQYRHYVYDAAVPHSLALHEVENYHGLLAPLGIREKGLPSVRAPLRGEASSTVAIHVRPGGSRHYLKTWPDEYWVDLIGRLTRAGYTVSLTGSGADRPELEGLAGRCSRPEMIQVMAGRLSLEETAALVKSAVVTISVDTGILHLASAVGANLVALHGPTSPKRWGALNKNSISLESHLPCSPCVSIGYEKGCGVNRCMQAIKPDRVMAAVEILCGAGRAEKADGVA